MADEPDMSAPVLEEANLEEHLLPSLLLLQVPQDVPHRVQLLLVESDPDLLQLHLAQQGDEESLALLLEHVVLLENGGGGLQRRGGLLLLGQERGGPGRLVLQGEVQVYQMDLLLLFLVG